MERGAALWERRRAKNRREISRDSYLLGLISPLYGLANRDTYMQWKLSNDMRYYEASNLIEHMLCARPLPQSLHRLAESFLADGYDAIHGADFNSRSVDDQVLLIYRILTQDQPVYQEIS